MTEVLALIILGAVHTVRRVLRRADAFLAFLARQLTTSTRAARFHTANVQRVMAHHDMVADPDEVYYADQYLDCIVEALGQRYSEPFPIRFLDVGCGQGRIALPLAERCAPWGGGTGVDFTPKAVQQAQGYASQRGVLNLSFECEDAVGFLRRQQGESCEVLLFLEVACFMPKYREALLEARRILKPGGLLFSSFWSLYYRLLGAAARGDWDSACMLVNQREGYLSGGATWFSWHTAQDVQELLSQSGFRPILMRGIGVASGMEGDPLASIAQPSRLSREEQAKLAAIERTLGVRYPDVGRYILAVGERAP